MKTSLHGGRAACASPDVPVTPFAARIARAREWARGSLLARLLAISAILAGLAILGDSRLAGARAPSVGPPPSPVASAGPAATEVSESSVAALGPDAGAPAIAETTATPGARASPDDPVDLNAATLEDLRRLPGVGAKRAQAILAVRARLGGRFRQIEDLLKVKGIGRATLKRLRPLVRLGPSGARDAGP